MAIVDVQSVEGLERWLALLVGVEAQQYPSLPASIYLGSLIIPALCL